MPFLSLPLLHKAPTDQAMPLAHHTCIHHACTQLHYHHHRTLLQPIRHRGLPLVVCTPALHITRGRGELAFGHRQACCAGVRAAQRDRVHRSQGGCIHLTLSIAAPTCNACPELVHVHFGYNHTGMFISNCYFRKVNRVYFRNCDLTKLIIPSLTN